MPAWRLNWRALLPFDNLSSYNVSMLSEHKAGKAQCEASHALGRTGLIALCL